MEKNEHIIRKVFLDFEKEEKWLNEMVAKGLNFVCQSPVPGTGDWRKCAYRHKGF